MKIVDNNTYEAKHNKAKANSTAQFLREFRFCFCIE